MSSRRRRGGTGGGHLPSPDRLLRPSLNKGGVRGKSDQRDNEMRKMKVIMIRFFVSDQRQRRGGQAPPGVRGGVGEKVWAGGTARSRTESLSQCL